jgi:hypothetical protein
LIIGKTLFNHNSFFKHRFFSVIVHYAFCVHCVIVEQSIDIILCLILIIAFEYLVLWSKCTLYSMM